jgi:hypothetical protein
LQSEKCKTLPEKITKAKKGSSGRPLIQTPAPPKKKELGIKKLYHSYIK